MFGFQVQRLQNRGLGRSVEVKTASGRKPADPIHHAYRP